ncbi:lipid-binding protein [Mucilaginibacter pallidiroseus]|uniref:Lipid-binding protein n=1 Tax=Mucilaginibacter pallidiroseus TaxID=2599295 RepID=A0A563UK47_9SPHI|nr:START domain-containing protein [Mucilaginibacter pallidiroseus]TWR31713.1 lipid-binding protein [Mucilaginibacter pallidiroseus]
MIKYILAALLTLSCAITASAQEDWKLSTQKDGIKVYTRSVPNSKLKALKVDCNFNATLTQMTAILTDVKNRGEWVYHTKSFKFLKQASPTDIYYYSEVAMPWPLQNRDFIAQLVTSQNNTTKVVTIDGPLGENIIPVKEGVVRITDSKSKWLIIPIDKDEVKVEYVLQVDPGGTIPAWLVNMFASEGPIQSFKALKLQLKKPEYKDKQLAFVKDY